MLVVASPGPLFGPAGRGALTCGESGASRKLTAMVQVEGAEASALPPYRNKLTAGLDRLLHFTQVLRQYYASKGELSCSIRSASRALQRRQM